jgi:hypothetical protein
MRLIKALLPVLLVGGCMNYMSEPPRSKHELTAELAGPAPARGKVTALYSPTTRILQWRMSFRELSGPVTWAFFRGPDGVGNVADIVPVNPPFEAGAHRGGATLTDRQGADLIAGRWSVVIKTEQHPEGELRGPLVPDAR